MKRNTRYSRSGQQGLSERDMLMDLLCTEKSMSHLYDHGIMEAANDEVRYTFEELQHDEHENAYHLFKAMQERGWYNTGSTDSATESGRSRLSPEYSSAPVSQGFVSRGNRVNNQSAYRRRVTDNSFV